MNSERATDEIDIVELLRKIYNSWRTIILISFIMLIIGVIVSFAMPLKYKSSTIFIPQSQENNLSCRQYQKS